MTPFANKRIPSIKNNESATTGNQRLYSMIDLFAGCGGLSLGFENAHFTPVFVNELNNDALATYLLNRNHSLGGELFAKNEMLRCNDAQELQGKRLDQLASDLASLPEVGFKLETSINKKSGSGSNLDVLTGGPPCQGYSGIGIRRSYAVDRKEIPSNHLFGRMADIIRNLRPRIFLFENVRGLLNAKWTQEEGQAIWPDVLKEFKSIPGYEVRWSLVRAKDYGVPQNRPRVLLVGIRKDILDNQKLRGMVDASADAQDAVTCGFLPAAKKGDFPHLGDLLGDLVDPSIPEILRSQSFAPGVFKTSKYPHPFKKDSIQEQLRQPPVWSKTGKVELSDQEYSKHKWEIVDKFDTMIKNKGEIPDHYKTRKFSQRLLPKNWGNTEPNITATSLPDDYVHFNQPRVLTVREWARLQLFPDWYRFSGKRTTGGIRRAGNPTSGIFDREVPKYTQIGNAVPVELAERVGLHFKAILDTVI